jgi:hypothetical protein
VTELRNLPIMPAGQHGVPDLSPGRGFRRLVGFAAGEHDDAQLAYGVATDLVAVLVGAVAPGAVRHVRPELLEVSAQD